VFLLKTDSGYPKDTGFILLFTLANHENPIRYHTVRSALLVVTLAHSTGFFLLYSGSGSPRVISFQYVGVTMRIESMTRIVK